MFVRRRLGRFLAAGPIGAVLGAGLAFVPAAHVRAEVVVHTRAEEVTGPLERVETRDLPFAARHVALYWGGNPEATVTVAFSRDRVNFSDAIDAERDEVGEQAGNGHTYGAVHSAGGAVAVRVSSDQPLARLTVLALTDGATTTRKASVSRSSSGASTAPPVVPRSGWNADESLRFDRRGKEIWPPVFQTVQKLVVHHTAGSNLDKDQHEAKATIRSIYYYHAVTQGWGDIGYNFLVDKFGHTYQGRYTTSPDATTGEDSSGKGVTAGHAYGYNSGTVGVALLGTFTNQGPTDAARLALQDFLVWKADSHGIDPTGRSMYTNPLNGTQGRFANIAGHKEVPDNGTECPGDFFFGDTEKGLSAVIQYVDVNTVPPPDTTPPEPPGGVGTKPGKRQITVSWSEPQDSGSGSGGGISGVAGYEVYRSGTLLTRTSATTYTDSGIRSGTSYSYHVKAYDGAGNVGQQSASATGTAA